MPCQGDSLQSPVETASIDLYSIDLLLDSAPHTSNLACVQKNRKDPNYIAGAIANAAAVLIDFDGVIIDSEWPIYQTWRRVFQSQGHELSQDIYIRCIGSNFDTWSPPAYLEELTGETFDWDKINAERQVELTRDLEDAEPMPGAAELLKKLEHSPSAIVSSSSHRWVDG